MCIYNGSSSGVQVIVYHKEDGQEGFSGFSDIVNLGWYVSSLLCSWVWHLHLLIRVIVLLLFSLSNLYCLRRVLFLDHPVEDEVVFVAHAVEEILE